MKTLNNSIAVEPIELDHNKAKSTEIVTGFKGTEKTLRVLISGKAVFNYEDIKAGQRLYFKSEISKFSWFSEKHTLKTDAGDIEFILIPKEHVVVVSE